MNCTELKKEMNALRQALKIGLPEKILSEDYADQEAERVNKVFYENLEESLINLFEGKSKLVKSMNLKNQRFFYSTYEYYDEAKGEEYQQLFYELNLEWFKIQEKIIQCDCGSYEIEYTLSSELNQLFSESPEHRTERIEGPLLRQQEAIDEQLRLLEEKKNNNQYYLVEFDEEVFSDMIAKIESFTYDK
jgi:hypothetical protein